MSVPGSKSITNRALAIAALCRDDHDITIFGALQSRDTEIMQKALCALGRNVQYRDLGSSFLVRNYSGGLFPKNKAKINVGNAGTAARFLTALLCLQKDGEYEVDGDVEIYKRPMKGLADALTSLGAEFTFHETPGCIPFTVKTHGVKGGNVQVDASESSQILSALLIMAAGVGRPFEIELVGKTVSEPFVEMTLKVLGDFSVTVNRRSENKFIITGLASRKSERPSTSPRLLPPYTYFVDTDATAASYFLSLPVSVGGSVAVSYLNYVIMEGECAPQNPEIFLLQGDVEFIKILREIGIILAPSYKLVKDEDHDPEDADPPEDYLAQNITSDIKSITADFNDFSDTFLTLAAVSPLLSGVTRIEGIGHTRRQETDRVHAAFIELHDKLGQEVIEEPDALEIHPNPEALKKLAQDARDRQKATGQGTGCIEIDTYHDHRFAMSFAILGCRDLLGDGKPWLAIKDPACCKKTFPNFFDVLEKARTDSNEA